MEDSSLKLSEQICFPIYASSRLITRLYQPLLNKIGLTYPQYLVMMVLWEHGEQKVTEIGNRIFLNTNTLTPLISKLIAKGLITKDRSNEDERTVFITLTSSGIKLKESAECIPYELAKNMNMSADELLQLKNTMWKILKQLDNQ